MSIEKCVDKMETCGEEFEKMVEKNNSEENTETGIKMETIEDVVIKSEIEVVDNFPDVSDVPISKKYVCKECGSSFKRNYSLQVHMSCIHSETRNHKCSLCFKTFKVKTSLTRHMHSHSPCKIVVCEFCEKTFRNSGLYSKHVKTVHCNISFKCEICDKILKSRKGYLEHHKLHKDERPFQCAHCDATFKWREVLKKHVLNHVPRRQQKKVR